MTAARSYRQLFAFEYLHKVEATLEPKIFVYQKYLLIIMKTATDLVLERFLSRYWDMSRPLRGNSTNVSTLVLATWDHLNTADMDVIYNIMIMMMMILT